MKYLICSLFMITKPEKSSHDKPISHFLQPATHHLPQSTASTTSPRSNPVTLLHHSCIADLQAPFYLLHCSFSSHDSHSLGCCIYRCCRSHVLVMSSRSTPILHSKSSTDPSTDHPPPHRCHRIKNCRTHLNKSNISALLPEALTADVETVFADQTGGVGADAAIYERNTLVLVDLGVHFYVGLDVCSDVKTRVRADGRVFSLSLSCALLCGRLG